MLHGTPVDMDISQFRILDPLSYLDDEQAFSCGAEGMRSLYESAPDITRWKKVTYFEVLDKNMASVDSSFA